MDDDREFAVLEPSGQQGDSTWVSGPSLVRSLWRYRLVIVAVTAVAAIAGYAAALLLPPRYEAQANLYLHDPGSPAVLNLGGSSQSQSGDHAIFMATQTGFATSDAVYGRALQVLNRPGVPDDLRRSVVVGSSTDLSSLTIRATSSDPVEAANVSNAVGTAYQQVAGERIAADSKDAITRIQDVVAQREAEFDSLSAQILQAPAPAQPVLERKALHVGDLIGTLQAHQSEIAAQAALYASGVESFEQAVPPVTSSQLSPLVLALSGALLGLVAAGGWAWWAAGRHRRVEADGDTGAILGVPLLGETPRLGAKMHGTNRPSWPGDLDPVAAEAYHVVLASLEHALSRVGGKVVAVASAAPGEGKTVTVLNLALAARREGRTVLLVDGDERTQGLSQLSRAGEYFDVIGVSHDGDQRPETSLVMQGAPTPWPRQEPVTRGTVLQIGPAERNGHHPAVFFRSTAFGELIDSSGEAADLVLIDTPALLDVSEAVTIADHADAVLLVVSRGTSLADLRRARERLAFTDTPLIGYVLNRGFAQRAYAGR
jgi:Mrp family chromosome partitioning ATPase/capsular polysaccharide biosynthesis protein